MHEITTRNFSGLNYILRQHSFNANRQARQLWFQSLCLALLRYYSKRLYRYYHFTYEWEQFYLQGYLSVVLQAYILDLHHTAYKHLKHTSCNFKGRVNLRTPVSLLYVYTKDSLSLSCNWSIMVLLSGRFFNESHGWTLWQSDMSPAATSSKCIKSQTDVPFQGFPLIINHVVSC